MKTVVIGIIVMLMVLGGLYVVTSDSTDGTSETKSSTTTPALQDFKIN